MTTKLEKLTKARDLINEVVESDLREVVWVRHARVSWSYLKDAIRELERSKDNETTKN